jgi:hypothetical protein
MALYDTLLAESGRARDPLRAVSEIEAERDRATAAVEEHAAREWREQALEAVRRTALARPEFIVDDVWDVGGLESTVEDRALGPVMLAAKRKGFIEKTDRVRPSKRSHLSGKPVWRSLIVQQGRSAA